MFRACTARTPAGGRKLLGASFQTPVGKCRCKLAEDRFSRGKHDCPPRPHQAGDFGLSARARCGRRSDTASIRRPASNRQLSSERPKIVQSFCQFTKVIFNRIGRRTITCAYLQHGAPRHRISPIDSSSPRLIPIEARPHVRASFPARPTDEQRLYVAKPDVIGPAVAADRDRVAAPIIRAIDQETANAHVAHVAGGFFCGRVMRP